jgi:hypothetical protein
MPRPGGVGEQGEQALPMARCPFPHSHSAPVEPPITEKRWLMLKWSTTTACPRSMSRIVVTGRSSPKTLRVARLAEAGPVETMHPLITFEQTTKNLSVSINANQLVAQRGV